MYNVLSCKCPKMVRKSYFVYCIVFIRECQFISKLLDYKSAYCEVSFTDILIFVYIKNYKILIWNFITTTRRVPLKVGNSNLFVHDGCQRNVQ